MLSLSVASPSTATFYPKPALSKTSFHGVRIAQLWPARVTPGALRKPSSASSVVMMAKREEEMKEIRAKTTEEINEEIVDLKGELLMLRLQKATRNEFKSSEFRRMRKRASEKYAMKKVRNSFVGSPLLRVARMLTVRRERELEEGINRRLSRKLDRQWKKSIVYRPPSSLKKLREEEAAAEGKESA